MTAVEPALGGGAAAANPAGEAAPAYDLARYIRSDPAGEQALNLMVEGVHCGGCIARIERALKAEPDVTEARLNFTTRRLRLRWRGEAARGSALVGLLEGLGYRAVPYDPSQLGSRDREEARALLRAMAVAGFAAGNIMLLSISVWAGDVQGMGEMTRALLHWISALIALPALAYAGRPFFASALGALKGGHTNMDVPISLAVVLTAGMSLFETVRGGPHVYFDSAVTLLFFLLVGRFLDRRARGRARSAAERLIALAAGAVTRLAADGSREVVQPDRIRLGDQVLVAPGERIAVDGEILEGRSEVDGSLITGETLPQAVGPGERVYAGTLNQSAALRLTVTAVGEDTLLAEIVRLMEVAEQRKARYVEVAERIARLYAPGVHALAAATFLGWLLLTPVAWQQALLTAVAVLIITCPCALGLAVPAVQVLASGRLMRSGVLLKSASALERLARVDTVVFDKTGTLTLGRPELVEAPDDPAALEQAAALAAASKHPLARALVRALPETPALAGVRELPGRGLAWDGSEGEVRLGSAAWCGLEAADTTNATGPELWLARPGAPALRFGFEDAPRADAAETVARLRAMGLRVLLLSGDRRAVAERVGAALGIEEVLAECRPEAKVETLERLAAPGPDGGRRVAMVGDGLNDAPALAAALVSISPATAADISQSAADAVFQGEALAPVAELLALAHRAERLVRQNFALSFAYNAITVPLAVLGYVTPLIAAISMSASSLLVVGNALRLGRGGAAR